MIDLPGFLSCLDSPIARSGVIVLFLKGWVNEKAAGSKVLGYSCS
jgi:hypothetical protein